MMTRETRRRCIEHSSTIIRESDRRAAFFWARRRVPWPHISGSSDDAVDGSPRDSALRELIRERLRSGELVCLTSARVWGGWADGTNTCAVCQIRIHHHELEYEPRDLRVTLFVHGRCLRLWETESYGA